MANCALVNGNGAVTIAPKSAAFFEARFLELKRQLRNLDSKRCG